MTETHKFFHLIIAVINLGLFVVLYRLGGWKDKVYRRYVGGILFPAGCNLIAYLSGAWAPLMLLSLATYPTALSIGYGASGTAEKLVRRMFYGLCLGSAALPLLIPVHLYLIALAQIVIAVLASAYYGTKNPMGAVGEEAQIALLSTALVPFALIT